VDVFARDDALEVGERIMNRVGVILDRDVRTPVSARGARVGEGRECSECRQGGAVAFFDRPRRAARANRRDARVEVGHLLAAHDEHVAARAREFERMVDCFAPS
jgi:hypothetical protein